MRHSVSSYQGNSRRKPYFFNARLIILLGTYFKSTQTLKVCDIWHMLDGRFIYLLFTRLHFIFCLHFILAMFIGNVKVPRNIFDFVKLKYKNINKINVWYFVN